ncbi:methylated-DNA--[protein]-cysteine S-methyltransferase [Alteribacillus iranensis]|uniref:Methylated-DNA--protein-cysteine methyltransferase n=1 Tax=Alteribacillus iranensis TaxID=930128 RepID=A0A1I2FLW4_9BACI|nr:methylated-DNA--[protein]-cysteine S-methyltransferase [Alteribacillus iranensis]SFF06013.1 methylated-DNA-[protein]-cysteine S-methyltransferase [Alteribacillus iranensis]
MQNDHQFFYQSQYKSPLGLLTVMATDEGVCMVAYGGVEETKREVEAWTKKHSTYPCIVPDQTEVLKQTLVQLDEYFSGGRKGFNLPLHLFGTSFQKSVWHALQGIPYGETCTYKEIAAKTGSPNAVRAVGGANNKNPVSIIIPCHRVIGSSGKMIGYGGGLDKKEYLLQLEKSGLTVN